MINQTRKKVIVTILSVLLIGGGLTALYLFNMPHRDVQKEEADYSIKASDVVNEYLSDANAANQKYLDESGDSKILEIRGMVHDISKDYNENVVVLLKAEGDKAGVSCTFSPETNANAEKLTVGSEVTIKGVIRSGASFDSDLDMYEDVIMEKCNTI